MFSNEYSRERRHIQKIFNDLFMRSGIFSKVSDKTKEELEKMYRDVKNKPQCE